MSVPKNTTTIIDKATLAASTTTSISTIPADTFTGSGLDDLTTGGTFTGPTNTDYRVQIDGTGSPDTFKWSNDGGATWEVSTVSITGSAQDLEYGVTITFAATTGHTLADRWDFTATTTGDCSSIDCTKGTQLTFTFIGKFHLSATAGAELTLWPSYDGNAFDTQSWNSWVFSIPVSAGNVIRKTSLPVSPAAKYMRVKIENKDAAQAITNLQVIATLQTAG